MKLQHVLIATPPEVPGAGGASTAIRGCARVQGACGSPPPSGSAPYRETSSPPLPAGFRPVVPHHVPGSRDVASVAAGPACRPRSSPSTATDAGPLGRTSLLLSPTESAQEVLSPEGHPGRSPTAPGGQRPGVGRKVLSLCGVCGAPVSPLSFLLSPCRSSSESQPSCLGLYSARAQVRSKSVRDVAWGRPQSSQEPLSVGKVLLSP